MTEADKLIESAKESISKAIKALTPIVTIPEETYGADQFNSTYLDDLKNVFDKLIEAKKLMS